MLDFRIDTFLAVCNTMNYTKAAGLLHMTQPAVSQHIHFLEQYYGTKLFDYEGKKLQLTKAGELLQQAVVSMKHDEVHLKNQMSALEDKKKKMVLGVTMTIGEFIIAGPVARFLRKNADISLKVITANTSELLQRMRQGEIDFAIVEGNFPRKEWEYLTYSEEAFIGVCGAEYPLSEGVARMEDLLQERLIIREEGSGTREVLVKDLERRNISLEDFQNTVEIGNMSTIKALVEAGSGITFLYETAVREELKQKRIRRLPLQDFTVKHNFSFIWNKGSIYREYYEYMAEELR